MKAFGKKLLVGVAAAILTATLVTAGYCAAGGIPGAPGDTPGPGLGDGGSDNPHNPHYNPDFGGSNDSLELNFDNRRDDDVQSLAEDQRVGEAIRNSDNAASLKNLPALQPPTG